MAILLGAMACAQASTYYLVVPVKGRTVAPPAVAVSLRAASLPNAVTGSAYNYDLKPLLQVTGDAAYRGSGVTWSAVAGGLPAGLALSADGRIAGIPTAAGSGTITVQATYKGYAGAQAYSVNAAAPVVANMTILSASYGANYGASGNRTAYVARLCNGLTTCVIPAGTLYAAPAGGDPYPGRPKNLVITFNCAGITKPTYTGGAEAGTVTNTLTCS
jgi:hypothetical protein